MPAGWVVALGVIVVLGIAAVATVMILNQNRTAQATAQEYFEALAAGDASAAWALTDPAAFEDGDVGFLTDEVLASATELISDVSVVPADDPLDTFDQRVNVAYTLAGERHTLPLLVGRGEPEWGFLKTYQMRAPFADRVSFSLPLVGTLTLADNVIRPDSPAMTLFPGVYPVAATEPDYLALDQTEVVVNGEGTRMDVTFQATAALEAQLQLRVNEFLDECALEMEMGEDDSVCPLFVYIAHADITPGSWEILEYPTVDLHPEGWFFNAEGGSALFTPANGEEPVEMYGHIDVPGMIQVQDGQVDLVTQW